MCLYGSLYVLLSAVFAVKLEMFRTFDKNLNHEVLAEDITKHH